MEQKTNIIRENQFKLRLQTKFAGKDRQAWTETLTSLREMDPYIDGFAETGRLERSRSPEKDIAEQDFIVSTSRQGFRN